MELLNRREADVDVVFMDTVKIVYLCKCDSLSSDMDIFVEKVFCGVGFQEVILGFSNDVGRIDEKEKVSVTLLVEVENQTCHDKRFAAAGRHG